MEAIIDRFEGEYVVIEYNKEVFNLPKKILPSEVKEGDVININIVINTKKTEELKKKIEKVTDSLWKE